MLSIFSCVCWPFDVLVGEMCVLVFLFFSQIFVVTLFVFILWILTLYLLDHLQVSLLP